MGAGLCGGGGAGASDPFSQGPLPSAGAGGAEPSGRCGLRLLGAGLDDGAGPMHLRPRLRGRAGRRRGGLILRSAGLGGPADPEEGPSAESPASGSRRFSRGALGAAHNAVAQPNGLWLLPVAGRGGGSRRRGSVCAAGLSSRGAGARAPPLLDSTLRRRPVSLRARPLLHQAFLSVAARGVHQAGPLPPRLGSWPPRPRPRWLCATETPRSVSGVGSPPHRLTASGRRRDPGAAKRRSGALRAPPHPNPLAQPCGRGSGASGRHRQGPVACFLLERGRCFVDFVCVSGFLRPLDSGRRGGRQSPAAAPPAPASPRLRGAPSPRSGVRRWG